MTCTPQIRIGTRQKGSALVDSSLCLLAFLLLLLGIADVGQFLFLQQTLTDRVRHAVAYGSRGAYDEVAIRNLVLYRTTTPSDGQRPFFNLTPEMVTVSRQNPGSAEDRIQVTVAGHPLTLLTPGLSDVVSSLPVTMSLAYDGT